MSRPRTKLNNVLGFSSTGNRKPSPLPLAKFFALSRNSPAGPSIGAAPVSGIVSSASDWLRRSMLSIEKPDNTMSPPPVEPAASAKSTITAAASMKSRVAGDR